MNAVQYPGGLLSTRTHVFAFGILMALLAGVPAISRVMPQGGLAVASVATWIVIPAGWSVQVLRTLGRVERQMTDPVPNEAMVMMFRTAMMLPVIGYGPLLMTVFWRH